MPEVNGQYRMNPQLAKVAGDQAGDTRTTPEQAGYMELDGAQKDGDCVLVSGGVSSKSGCCNLFDPAQGAQAFSCGTCTKIKGQNAGPKQGDEASSGNSASQSVATQSAQPVAP